MCGINNALMGKDIDGAKQKSVIPFTTLFWNPFFIHCYSWY